MFQFGRLPSYTYVFSIWYTSSSCMDCSIRKSTYHSVLTAPRGLSQLITSFFGSQCQGIRPALFLALPFVSCFWVLLIVNQYTSCSFTQQYFLLSFYTRSILICITFALFCFQVAFCSWEQISINNFLFIEIYSQVLWWAQMDSNHRPHAYQACALTTWAMRPSKWWRWGGSNSWPSACKADALPAELHPHTFQHLQNWTMYFFSPCWLGFWAFRSFLLRKEVIQPHLPIRLPCYDFAPIADPTVVASLRLLG